MNNEIKKEERTEYVSIYVTPTLKKEFEAARDNQALKESIIKGFLLSEKNWLEGELKEIDEATIKYAAKLIGIKEAFKKNNAAYVDEIEQIYKDGNDTLKKLDTVVNQTQKEIHNAKQNIELLINQVSKIDVHKVERVLDSVQRFSNMSAIEKELLKKLL